MKNIKLNKHQKNSIIKGNTNKRKLISIVVPVYNKESYLENCLNSIINQSYKNLEILLINDGSTDSSLDILKKFKKKDNRIKIINKKNEGATKSRNLGIDIAQGKFITFIDADDYIDENYIDEYVKFSDNYDIVVGSYKRIKQGKILYKRKLNETKWSKYINVSTMAKLYNRKFLLKNNLQFANLIIAEDVCFYISALKKTKKIKIIDSIGYNYIINPTSLTNTVYTKFDKNNDLSVLLDTLAALLDHGEYENYFINRFITYHLLYVGRNDTSVNFVKEVKKIQCWRKKNNYDKLAISPFSKKLNGESYKNRIIVYIFYKLLSLNLINLFSKFYCKGKNNYEFI